MQNKGFATIICLLMTTQLWSQKYEREHRVPVEDFPDSAITWLAIEYPTLMNPKLYREISDEGESYEAKFKSEGQWFSIEFNTDGSLQDIEKRIVKSDLNVAIWKQMTKIFNEHFDRWRIIKIQEQSSSIGVRYEIEVKGRGQSNRSKYQYLFSDHGEIIERKEILDHAPNFDLY